MTRRSSPRARNQHFELYDNVTIDRGNHRLKLGAYYFHLQLRPEQPDNARGAFTYTGQFTGNAFADFLLGYPTSATSGIGRVTKMAGPTGCISTSRTTGRRAAT